MSRKLVSALSIEHTLQNPTKDEYIANLKVQCRMRQQALKTAQSLIEAYQKQNESLREELKKVKSTLQHKEEQMMAYSLDQEAIKHLEKNVLRYSEKVQDLLEKNLVADKRIRSLEKELESQRQQNMNQREIVQEKVNQQRRNQKQRKDLESHFHNFLKLPQRQGSFVYATNNHKNSPGKQSLITAVTKNEAKRADSNIKVLQWKLRQKDEQVMILLKRMNDLEQRTLKADIQGRRERFFTQGSFENCSSRKGYDISQFTQ